MATIQNYSQNSSNKLLSYDMCSFSKQNGLDCSTNDWTAFFKCARVEILMYLFISCTNRLSFKMSTTLFVEIIRTLLFVEAVLFKSHNIQLNTISLSFSCQFLKAYHRNFIACHLNRKQ